MKYDKRPAVRSEEKKTTSTYPSFLMSVSLESVQYYDETWYAWKELPMRGINTTLL